jgi:hypothetical protein
MIWEVASEAARSCGYCLALHGSMARDLDIVAIPWTEEATTPEEVVAAIVKVTAFHFTDGTSHVLGPVDKPHGRKVWTIPYMAQWHLDLSVMPVASSHPELDRRYPQANPACRSFYCDGACEYCPPSPPQPTEERCPMCSGHSVRKWERGTGYVSKTTKTGFDRFLDEMLRDPSFRKDYEAARNELSMPDTCPNCHTPSWICAGCGLSRRP